VTRSDRSATRRSDASHPELIGRLHVTRRPVAITSDSTDVAGCGGLWGTALQTMIECTVLERASGDTAEDRDGRTQGDERGRRPALPCQRPGTDVLEFATAR